MGCGLHLIPKTLELLNAEVAPMNDALLPTMNLQPDEPFRVFIFFIHPMGRRNAVDPGFEYIPLNHHGHPVPAFTINSVF